MHDDDFEWDDLKAALNLKRHKVSFSDARCAFDDPFADDRYDNREDYREDRRSVLGYVGNRLLFVAYTVRGGRTHIITARLAEPFEKRLYHDAREH